MDEAKGHETPRLTGNIFVNGGQSGQVKASITEMIEGSAGNDQARAASRIFAEQES